MTHSDYAFFSGLGTGLFLCGLGASPLLISELGWRWALAGLLIGASCPIGAMRARPVVEKMDGASPEMNGKGRIGR